MGKKLNLLRLKMQKTWLKMLRAYSHDKTKKGKKLEQKIIQLELQIAREEKG